MRYAEILLYRIQTSFCTLKRFHFHQETGKISSAGSVWVTTNKKTLTLFMLDFCIAVVLCFNQCWPIKLCILTPTWPNKNPTRSWHMYFVSNMPGLQYGLRHPYILTIQILRFLFCLNFNWSKCPRVFVMFAHWSCYCTNNNVIKLNLGYN